MIAEAFDALMTMTLLGSTTIAGILAARVPLRRAFGSELAYLSWIVVPLVLAATLWPAPMQPVVAWLPAARAPLSAPMVVDADSPLDLRPWLLAVWLSGVVFAALWFALQQRGYLRGLGRLQAVDGDPRIARAQFDIAGPALVGAWRPRIVLPADFEHRYTEGERALILAHERLHLARGDAQINALVAALRCLNWFNPFVHLAAAKFRVDQELACDAAVIARFPQARRPYADAMLKTQLLGQSRLDAHLPVGCRWPSHHPLKERIAMLKHSSPTRSRRVLGRSLVVVAGLCSAYVAWAVQTPRVAAVPSAARQVEAVLSIELGGAKQDVRLVNPEGRPFSVRNDDPAHPWQAEFTAHEVEGGHIRLDGTISDRGRVIGQPELVVEQGQPATMQLGDDGAGHAYRIEATLWLHDGSWKPDAESVATAGMRDAPNAAADAGAPVREDIRYRSSVPPTYPPKAAAAGRSAHIELKVLVDEDGKPTSAEVLRAEPPDAKAEFGEASVAAVMQWTFFPARVAGRPVSGYVQVPFDFRIDSTPAADRQSASPASSANAG